MSLAVVVHGPSQSGKSTFLGQVMLPGQGAAPEVGDGSGESVTQDIQLLKTQVGLLVDRPGDNDTMMRFSNQEAGKRCAVAVAEAGVMQLKFLVFDSMGADTMQLRATFASLVTTFGDAVLQGVVVVASKKDLSQGNASDKRLQAVWKVMESHGITELVTWQSQGLDDEGSGQQLVALQQSLSRVQGVSTDALEDLWQRQQRRARELCDAQPTRTREVEVQEQYLVPYSAEESWTEQEAYQTTESYSTQETYTDTEIQCVQVPQSRPLGGTYNCKWDTEWKGRWNENAWGGPMDWSGVVAIFHSLRGDIQHFSINRGKMTCRRNFQVRLCNTGQIVLSLSDIMSHPAELTEQTETHMVPHQVSVPVTRSRTVQRTRPATAFRPVERSRTVVRQREATRTVTKTVEYTLPLEDFVDQALSQIIAQVQATFKQCDLSGVTGVDVRPEDSVSQVGSVPAPKSLVEGPQASGMIPVPEEVGSHASVQSHWSLISAQAEGPRCYMLETIFSRFVGSHRVFVDAQALVYGSIVIAADGKRELQVVSIKKHTAQEVMVLFINGFRLKVTPTHRVMVPAPRGVDSRLAGSAASIAVAAAELKVGDCVLCSSGEAQLLTDIITLKEETEVLEIRFQPDDPVAVFSPPEEMILTKGEELRTKKPTRRGGMNRRGRNIDNYPGTAPGEYSD